MYDKTIYDLDELEETLESDGIDVMEEAFMRGFIRDKNTIN